MVIGRDPDLAELRSRLGQSRLGLPQVARHRQVKLEGDREASKLARAANLCGSPDASDLVPDRERLRADGSVLGGWELIAVEMEEVVDLVVGREEPLRLAE